MRRRSDPTFAVALVALVLVLVTSAAAQPAGRAGDDLRKVVFTFRPDKAYERVVLAGTFNGWSTDATPMHRTEDGAFEITVPLAPGRYQYKFVADGHWITDDNAELFHPDGFGGQNSVVVVDDTFEEAAFRRGDGKITTDGLLPGQRSWELSVAAGGDLTIRTRAWAGDVQTVTLIGRSFRQSLGAEEVPGSHMRMRRFDCDGTYDYYTAELRGGQDFAYFFELRDGETRVFVGPDGISEAPGDVGQFRFEADLFPVFETPVWVKEGVIYQIFPERFANGNTDNDPDFSEWYYEGLNVLPASGKTNGEYFHLVQDWYDVAGLSMSPYKTDGKPDWNSFYGGDIAGVRQHLDYLQDLGVTIIYFNPVFESKSNHKYDAVSYTRVDPHLASNEEFAGFVRECHDRGMRVVIDLAFNHTGHTFWAFVDARKNGPVSRYWSWYEWVNWPIPGSMAWTPPNPKDYYDCWWGFGQMPNLKFDRSRPNAEEAGIAEIADADPNWPVVEHLLSAAVYWATEIGVDGFRLDVSADVPFWFWELFRERVKRSRPDAYIVGELWGASPDWVNGRYYDAVMNYKFFRDPVLSFIAKGEMSAQEFDRSLAPGRLIYPDQGVRAMMNLIGSHDTERFLTTAGGDVGRLKLAALLGMTYVGVPTIYYGDEIAMEGGGDPDCRRPFHWLWREEAGRVEVHDCYSQLAALRREHPSFVRGDFATLYAEGTVFAFRRSLADEQFVVIMNTGPEEITAAVPLGEEALRTPRADEQGDASESEVSGFTTIWPAESAASFPVVPGEAGATLTVTLPPLVGYVLRPAVSGAE